VSLMGLDIGSTGTKAVVFDEEGRLLSQAYREYAEVYPGPGMIELRPDEVWSAICQVIAQAAAGARHDPVRALCISALGEAFTPVDAQGRFLYNCIVSPDSRAVQQAQRWQQTPGAQRVFSITGMPPHSSFTLNKIMWLKEHAPEVHQATSKYLLWPEIVHLKLGLTPRLDWSLAGRTMAFDVVAKKWADELLQVAGIDSDLFAEPIRPGEVVGELAAGPAEEVGLPAGCLVVAGGHDQPMNALGAGVIRQGLAVDGMGTVECITVAFDEPVLTPRMLKYNYCCYPHVYDDMYVTIAFNYTSGSVLRWFRDQFGQLELQRAQAEGADVYDLILSDLPTGPTGLYLVPYLAGSGTPYLDPLAKGALVGLTLDTDRKTFIKALLEGLCYELALNIEYLGSAGVSTQRLRATGGGAKSPLWLQLKADITGKEVVTLSVTESGCQAGAILGGVATGVYESVQQAVEQVVREQTVYTPDSRAHEQYAEHFAIYKDLWPTLESIVHRMH